MKSYAEAQMCACNNLDASSARKNAVETQKLVLKCTSMVYGEHAGL